MAFRGIVEEHAAQKHIARQLVALVRLSSMLTENELSSDGRATDGLALKSAIDALTAEIYTVMCKSSEQSFGFVMEVVELLRTER